MLISEAYRTQNAKLHENPGYGCGSATKQYWPLIVQGGKIFECRTLLDYGCGKGAFKSAHPDLSVSEYDPAISEKLGDPEPCDMVFCLDVMEHIEPEMLDDVLKHMASKALKAALISVATRPAKKILDDGRNAHLIQAPASWWMERISQYFRIHQFAGDKNGFWTLCAADKS